MRRISCLLFVMSALGFSGCALLDPLLPVPAPNPLLFKDLSGSELQCLVFDEAQSEHVIRTRDEYRVLFEHPRQFLGIPECKNLTRQPPVDLSKYTILGLLTRAGGCDARFQRVVNLDDTQQRVTYRVVMQSFGLCEMLISNRNWIAIPRVPKTYEVEFGIEHRQWASTTPVPELVLQLEYEPTFAPYRWVVEFGHVPPFSLYKDGTVIYLRTMPDSSEQLVRMVNLSESETESLLKRIEDLGFDRLASREPKPGEPLVADAPFTVLRMMQGDALKEVRVYFEYVSNLPAWRSILNFLLNYDHVRAEDYLAQQATLFVRKLTNEEAAQYDNARVRSWPYNPKYLKPNKPNQHEWAWIFGGAELAQYWQENGVQFTQSVIYGGTGGLYEIEVVPWLPDQSFSHHALENYPLPPPPSEY